MYEYFYVDYVIVLIYGIGKGYGYGDSNSCLVHSYAAVDVVILASVTTVSVGGTVPGRGRPDLTTGTAGVTSAVTRVKGPSK